MKKYIPHLISIIIFVIISVVYFSPVIDGKILSAHDIDTWKGMSKEVRDYRSDTGEEALWTKRMFSGMPAYQISTRSNGNLIQYVDKIFRLGLPRPMDMLFLYLIGFYILLCSLKIDYRLSIVGAIAFAFSSYFIIIIQAGHMTKAHAIAYLPLIVASVLYTYREKKWMLGIVFTSLFVALQLYSNHYQITYYTIIILIFIGFVQFVKELQDKNLMDFFKKSALLVLAGTLAGATNYTRLSTTLEYGPETQRGKSELINEEGKEKKDGLGLEYATRWSYGKAETMTFLIPNFMGGSTGRSVLNEEGSKTLSHLRGIRNKKKQQNLQQQTSSYWGDQPGTSPTYVGSIVVFLFILGIMYVKSTFRIWILFTTILSIALAWGSNFMPLTEFFFNYVPAYNKFRAVTMALIIAEFGIALLAILALNKFLNNEENKEKEEKLKLAFYISAGITLVFALFPSIFLNFLSSKESLSIIETSLKTEKGSTLSNLPPFYEALTSDRSSLLQSDAWRSFVFILLSATALWMFLKGNLKKHIVVGFLGILIISDMWSIDKRFLNETHFVKERNVSIKPSQADRTILKNNNNQSRVFNYNNPFNESKTSYFHNSIGGYHAAKLLRYQELIDNHLTKGNVSVLSMLNCGWIITPQGIAIRSTSQGINPLGHAWFVSENKIVENANDELEALSSFNPLNTAIIDKRYTDKIKDFIKDESATINLDLKSYQPNHLIYNVQNVNSDQLAVFSEIYYKNGWNSYIDDKIVPHFRANYVLRAMIVPKGTTKIEFKFEPSSYSIGESVAYASSIFLLLLLGFVSYRELK
ncbi:MAG: hypothetical protein CMD02_01810 [Flavobacteriales bacterium]|nr:hypothetical protein [Flavobacteriales bacterium]|tara:strand:- start:783 stop:3215 length:2433 start_codon:yes stop_codon:yes gene_type:complete